MDDLRASLVPVHRASGQAFQAADAAEGNQWRPEVTIHLCPRAVPRVNCRVPPLPTRRRAPSSRLPWLLVGVPLALLLGVVVALFGLRWWVYNYLRGEAFRRQLDEHASNALHAAGRFEPLQWQDTEVYTDAFDAVGGPGSPLAKLDAEQIRARLDLGALWHHAWRVDSIELTKFSATLPSGEAVHTARARRGDGDGLAAEPPSASTTPPEKNPGFFAGLLPDRFEIGEVRVNDFSLAWNTDRPADAGHLRGVELKAHPLTADNRSWQIDGQNGDLTQAYFPALRLTAFNVKTTPHEVFITRAEGQADVGGHLELSGRQALDGDRALDLRVDFDGLPAGDFLPPNWRARLKGLARGNVHVTNSADQPAAGGPWGTSNCAMDG